MTTPAAKPARSTKSSPTPKPAAKRASKSSAQLAVVPEPTPAPKTSRKAKGTPESANVVEQHPLAKTMTPEQVERIGELHDALVAATEAFEAEVVELLVAGASPSHVGNAVGLGNSSVRRILWRRRPELAPKS